MIRLLSKVMGKRQIQIEVPDMMHRQFKNACRKRQKSMTDVLRGFIRYYLVRTGNGSRPLPSMPKVDDDANN